MSLLSFSHFTSRSLPHSLFFLLFSLSFLCLNHSTLFITLSSPPSFLLCIPPSLTLFSSGQGGESQADYSGSLIWLTHQGIALYFAARLQGCRATGLGFVGALRGGGTGEREKGIRKWGGREKKRKGRAEGERFEFNEFHSVFFLY